MTAQYISLRAVTRSTTLTKCLAPHRHLFSTYTQREKALKHDIPSPAPSTSKSRINNDYYALLLDQPLSSPALSSRPSLPASTVAAAEAAAAGPAAVAAAAVNELVKQSSEPDSLSTTSAKSLDRARITFGSKLVGPGTRAKRSRVDEVEASLEASGQGTYISGIWVPPKPAEPDNCCMSGCVNCVWDGYREELEEWVGRMNDARMLAEKSRGGDNNVERLLDGAEGRDKHVGMVGLESAMNDIPVGIREFMKIEKKLQQQRLHGGS